MEILLIEPNAALSDAIRTRLIQESFDVVSVQTGTDALSLLDA
ncbi:MAG TPA: DNA-binding response regulator, partial [Ruminococcus sp.]|nr:DNA-binding response regulator [Ruminococcus sp.]